MALNFDKLQQQFDQRQQERSSFGDKTEFLSLKFGDNRIFVLPPLSQDHDLNVEVWLHWGLVDGKGRPFPVKCSKGEHGHCPICDQVDQLIGEGNQKRAEELKAQKFYLYNALNDQYENKILSTKPSQQKAIDAEVIAAFKVESVDVTDLSNGRQLYINRTKSDPWCTARTVPSPVGFDDQTQEVIRSKMVDLTSVYESYTPDQIVKILNGENPNPEQQPQTQQAVTGVRPTTVQPTTAPQPQTQQVSTGVKPNGVAPKVTSVTPRTTTSTPQPKPAPTPVAAVPRTSNSPKSSGGSPSEMSVEEIMAKLNS